MPGSSVMSALDRFLNNPQNKGAGPRGFDPLSSSRSVDRPGSVERIRATAERFRPQQEWGRKATEMFQGAVDRRNAMEAERKRQEEFQKAQQAMQEQQKEYERMAQNLSEQRANEYFPGMGYSGPTNAPKSAQGILDFAQRVGGVRGQILSQAASMLGTPYAWGGGGIGVRSSRGTGKGTQNVIGVDCSGLTSYVYGTVGIKLPRTSNQQTTVGVRTNIKNAKPGDLVGWNRGGHVAIYAGNGYIIESPKPGSRVQYRKLGDLSQVYAVSLRGLD